jgi:hypothetical protein
MNNILSYMICLQKNNANEQDYKQIIINLTNEINDIKDELEEYKKFHDAILENNVIQEKFEDYEEIIKKLKKENNTLQKKINVLDDSKKKN